MPFGVKNGPFIYQNVVNKTFMDYLEKLHANIFG
jgi:hypothetical protein